MPRFYALMILVSLAQPATAINWAGAALDQGFSAYSSGDYPQARSYFGKLADHGSAIGETMMGTIYARGQGVAHDPATAAIYWFRAANRGYAPAQLEIARALEEGRGVSRDPGGAWVWAQLAVMHGDANVARQAASLVKRLMKVLPPFELARQQAVLDGWRPWADTSR
jgi:hypothetical protein